MFIISIICSCIGEVDPPYNPPLPCIAEVPTYLHRDEVVHTTFARSYVNNNTCTLTAINYFFGQL